jgi:hypothetical protein
MQCCKRTFQFTLFLAILIIGCKQPVKTTTMQQTTVTAVNAGIKPSASSSENDFDFLPGKWKVYNRKLKARLAGSTEWDEFESELHMRKTLNGLGNIENYYASFDGKPFEGMAVRLFNPATKLWTIYWVDSNGCTMDEHPVTGSFEKGVGKFYANDVFNGKPVLVLYQWDATDLQHPKWSQAFSVDDGKTWEWNWEMKLTRAE